MQPDTIQPEVSNRKIIKSSFSHLVLLFLLVLVVAALSAFATYYYLTPQLAGNPHLTAQYKQTDDQTTATDNLVKTTPLPRAMVGKQENCPAGFLYYENAVFSLCYPSDMTVDTTSSQVIEGTKNTVIFSKAFEQLEISPNFSFEEPAGGSMTCDTRENATIAGFIATRRIHKETLPSGCGNISQIETTIPITTSNLLLIQYDTFTSETRNGTNTINPNLHPSITMATYTTIEKYFHIK